MEINLIRSKFLEYFNKNNHEIVPSSSLMPQNDPSLLFTNAGMVQFKDYFTGLITPPFKAAASSQKCVRAGGKHNDLENVGYTARHHTFFGMLGNFSFGDYFKEEAIKLAWNLLTKEFGIDQSKLYITVYHTDNEAYNIWQKITGFTSSKIIRIPTSDNFWSMGDTGPCGPCSEIFYDHGDKYQGGLPGSADADGDRYIEIWNLVFMQYEDLKDGNRISLPKPSIDTGMGLERIAAVLQGKNDNFDIDLFQKLIEQSKHLTSNNADSSSHKVIADHIRSICFLIADGVMPDNEGRGYVLRRIMRRAMRHFHTLGGTNIELHKMVPILVKEMGDAYPELNRAQATITSVLKSEESRFQETLDKGLKILEDEVAKLAAGSPMSGKVAFKLYDTYGFPLDLTSDILRTKHISVDVKEFDNEMQEQKRRARAAWAGSGEEAIDSLWPQISNNVKATEFLGYSHNESEAEILAIIQNGKVVKNAKDSDAIIILNQTPFYAEAGGQIGDTGLIADNPVKNTIKYAGKLYGHHIEVVYPLKVGQMVNLSIDLAKRQQIRANHSATHLLHKALKTVLGNHINQKGSLVSDQRLRFDFSHPKALSSNEIKQVELLVNNMIMLNSKVDTSLMSPQKAIEQGAMALFGEKYGDEVRVVSMGDSLELCGGTHVNLTGNIGIFKIVSEEAISSGIRRIEAITGILALEYINKREMTLNTLASQLKCSESDLIKKVTSIVEERKQLEKDLSNLKIHNALNQTPICRDIRIGKVYILKLYDIAPSDVKSILSSLQKRYHSQSIIIISVINNNKVSMLIDISTDLQSAYKANELAQIAASTLKGSGGGRPQTAQAGGDDKNLLESAIEALITNLTTIKNKAE